MRYFTCFIFSILISLLSLDAGAAAERRLALVIGVQSYQFLPPLRNTVSDAELIGERLRAVGFEVDPILKDPSKDELSRAVRDFARKIEQAGEDAKALVFYSGHGVQDDSHVNYLLAKDADVRSQVDLVTEGFSLDLLLKTLEKARPRIAFAILDACRDNPLPATATRGSARGLALPEEQPVGIFIVYSTAPGRTAVDGPPGGHSPFAEALGELITSSEMEATPLFKLVANRVYQKTASGASSEGQLPWTTGQYVGDFYFKSLSSAGSSPPAPPQPTSTPSAAVPSPPPTAPQPGASAPANADDAGEIEFGRAVVANTVTAYENWIRDYPNHPKKPNAFALLKRLREEELWKRAKIAVSTEDRIGVLDQLVAAYPDGVYAEKAKEERSRLTAAAPPAQTLPARYQPSSSPAGASLERYEGKDAPGSDLGHWVEDVSEQQCERQCLADRACVGFTYNLRRSVCIEKAAIRHLTPAADAAVTVVIPDRTAAPSVERPGEAESAGVKRYTGMDAPGYDRGAWIRNVNDESRCRQICEASPDCAGYTYNIDRRVCIPKTRIGDLKPSREPAVTGVLTGRKPGATAPQRASVIRYHDGMDAPGHDIKPWLAGVSQMECEQRCLSQPGCAGLTYNLKRSTCILKDRIGALVPSRDPATTAEIGGR